jgi:hypothetical protein
VTVRGVLRVVLASSALILAVLVASATPALAGEPGAATLDAVKATLSGTEAATIEAQINPHGLKRRGKSGSNGNANGRAAPNAVKRLSRATSSTAVKSKPDLRMNP